MNGPARATFALLWLGLATAGAVLCHRAAEVHPGPYNSYTHAAVAPVAVLATILLAMLVLAACADRAKNATGPRLWFVRGAASTLATSSRRSVFIVLLLQLGVTFAMEEAEHIMATGRPCGGFTWLGLAPPVALALHAFVAVLAVVVLRALLRGVVDACETLLRLVLVVLRAILFRSDVGISGRPRTHAPLLSRPLPIGRHRALRAPPAILRSAT